MNVPFDSFIGKIACSSRYARGWVQVKYRPTLPPQERDFYLHGRLSSYRKLHSLIEKKAFTHFFTPFKPACLEQPGFAVRAIRCKRGAHPLFKWLRISRFRA
jgi:hypothetical protein